MHATTRHERPTAPARILIVDSDPHALAALPEAVTRLGYTVCQAAEPGSAVCDLPAEVRPDLALIGLEADETAAPAIETAERIAERFGVPLVYALETIDTSLLDRAQRTNPHGYVLKSADSRQLGLTIRAALSAAARERADRQRRERESAELKATAAVAARNTAVLTCLFERISDAVILGDPQGRLKALNPAARKLGKQPLEDPNKWADYFIAYHADGRTPFASEELPLVRAIRGEATQDVPLILRPRHAEVGAEDLWLSASGYPLRDAQGQSFGGAVLLRDMTVLREQKEKAHRAERKLRERVRVLDAIIRSMTEGVTVADVQGRFTLFNPSAERIVGMAITDQPPEEWPDLYGIYYEDGATKVPPDLLPLVRAVRGETVVGQELFIRNPSVPKGAHINVSATPLRDETGGIVGGVSVFRDVSGHRMNEEALTQAFALGRLEVIDTVMHNVGNAISSVTTGVDTLREWFEGNELTRRLGRLGDLVAAHDRDWISWLEHDPQGRQVRPFLLALLRDLTNEHKKLLATADRVRERVRHIVDIIRTQAAFASGTVERKLVDLRTTIEDAVKVLQESLGQRGIAVEVDCSHAPREIVVQESRFQQMLVNLIKNAMEATDERAAGGKDDPDWRPRIRVAAYRGGQEGSLVIDVTDNGIGIDPSRFGSVFNGGYTTKKDGTGLGLHASANFVIAAGGNIRPMSDGIGHGATLRVTLRVLEELKQARPPI